VGTGLLAMASLRCVRRTAPLASQASQLPQFLRCSLKPEAAGSLCGSGLARDGIAAVRQADRVVCIAGKPAPTVFAVLTKSGGLPRPSVGAGLLAMASLRCARRTALSASQASQLPQFLRCSQNPGVCRVPLWERACSRWHRCGASGGPRLLHRRQASSHRFYNQDSIIRRSSSSQSAMPSTRVVLRPRR
jgi:hypothetical protein